MTRSSRPRKTANVSDSVQHKLNMYALAANAAGVGMLALAQPAEAKIVYTPAHVILHGGSVFNLDLNHDGITDFVIQNYLHGHGAAVNVFSLRQNRVWGRIRDKRVASASALPAGFRVGPNQAEFQKGRSCYFSASHYLPCKNMVGCTLTSQASTLSCGGPWATKTSGYLGLKFNVNGKTHYGWARLTLTHKLPTGVVATLTGYAYETIPNTPIITGKTKGPEDLSSMEQPSPVAFPAPTPVTLGALAIGAPGLSIWRREELASDVR